MIYFNFIKVYLIIYINNVIRCAISAPTILILQSQLDLIWKQHYRENSQACRKIIAAEKKDRHGTQGEFSSSCLIKTLGEREHVVWCESAYIHEQSPRTYIRGLMSGAALINMHSRRNIYRRRLLLEARALYKCDALAEVPADPTTRPRS